MILLSVQGCSEPCKQMSFESWRIADRIVVDVPGGKPGRVINDLPTIGHLYAFASMRKDGWEVPASDTPIGPIRVQIYNGDRGLSYFAVGKDFLETPGCGYVVSRKITLGERDEILKTIGVSNDTFH
jgi:hypothetical protein